MSVTQQQVQNALAKVRSPRGVALTEAGVLSAITVADGKVFFSINVDANEARAWEDVRAQAEAAVRAIPGRHLGHDRADRRAEGRCGAAAAAARAGRRRAAGFRAPSSARSRPAARRCRGRPKFPVSRP